MATPILSLRKVNKSFGPVHVLKDVDFDAYAAAADAGGCALGWRLAG